MPLTSPELDQMQIDAESWQTERCNIFRPSNADDAYGGTTETESSAIASNVTCAMESGAAQEQLMLLESRLRTTQIFTLFLPADQDVQVEDNLVVTTRGNMRLAVVAVFAPETNEIERRIIGSREGATV